MLAPPLVAKTKGGPRKPSAYNTFMKSEIARVKADHPDMGHKGMRAYGAGLPSSYGLYIIFSGDRQELSSCTVTLVSPMC